MRPVLCLIRKVHWNHSDAILAYFQLFLVINDPRLVCLTGNGFNLLDYGNELLLQQRILNHRWARNRIFQNYPRRDKLNSRKYQDAQALRVAKLISKPCCLCKGSGIELCEVSNVETLIERLHQPCCASATSCCDFLELRILGWKPRYPYNFHSQVILRHSKPPHDTTHQHPRVLHLNQNQLPKNLEIASSPRSPARPDRVKVPTAEFSRNTGKL